MSENPMKINTTAFLSHSYLQSHNKAQLKHYPANHKFMSNNKYLQDGVQYKHIYPNEFKLKTSPQNGILLQCLNLKIKTK